MRHIYYVTCHVIKKTQKFDIFIASVHVMDYNSLCHMSHSTCPGLQFTTCDVVNESHSNVFMLCSVKHDMPHNILATDD